MQSYKNNNCESLLRSECCCCTLAKDRCDLAIVQRGEGKADAREETWGVKELVGTLFLPERPLISRLIETAQDVHNDPDTEVFRGIISRKSQILKLAVCHSRSVQEFLPAFYRRANGLRSSL
jgi:hypothetical protein